MSSISLPPNVNSHHQPLTYPFTNGWVSFRIVGPIGDADFDKLMQLAASSVNTHVVSHLDGLPASKGTAQNGSSRTETDATQSITISSQEIALHVSIMVRKPVSESHLLLLLVEFLENIVGLFSADRKPDTASTEQKTTEAYPPIDAPPFVLLPDNTFTQEFIGYMEGDLGKKVGHRTAITVIATQDDTAFPERNYAFAAASQDDRPLLAALYGPASGPHVEI